MTATAAQLGQALADKTVAKQMNLSVLKRKDADIDQVLPFARKLCCAPVRARVIGAALAFQAFVDLGTVLSTGATTHNNI